MSSPDPLSTIKIELSVSKLSEVEANFLELQINGGLNVYRESAPHGVSASIRAGALLIILEYQGNVVPLLKILKHRILEVLKRISRKNSKVHSLGSEEENFPFSHHFYDILCMINVKIRTLFNEHRSLDDTWDESPL